MSVKFHEAVCFDSTQHRLDWGDDFWGDSLDARWRSTGDAGGSAAVVDLQTGGIVRLTTGATNGNAYEINWGDIRSLLVSKKVTMEFRLKANSVTMISGNWGLWFDAQNRIEFLITNTTIQLRCENNNVQTVVASGVTLDTDYHIYRITCFPTGEVHFYIDGVETANSPITTNIPPDYLQPWLQFRTDEDVAKSMDTDYVYVRQER